MKNISFHFYVLLTCLFFHSCETFKIVLKKVNGVDKYKTLSDDCNIEFSAGKVKGIGSYFLDIFAKDSIIVRTTDLKVNSLVPLSLIVSEQDSSKRKKKILEGPIITIPPNIILHLDMKLDIGNGTEQLKIIPGEFLRCKNGQMISDTVNIDL
ncbi:MAG: hypothetical protein QM763_00825 [Agriterribacter sp.]